MVFLNIGCGPDYRQGYINIDVSSSLFKLDKAIDLNNESLLDHFDQNSIDLILANDIVEHFFHWEAVNLLCDFFLLLRPFGKVEIRVPDSEHIINSSYIPLTQKLTMLFGGQDIAQGNNLIMDESRKKFPQFFCHKYGWTRSSMQEALTNIGFSNIKAHRAETNFVVYAEKL